MLKVCFVLGGFPVLSETFVINQITGLLDRGFDVSVVRDWNQSSSSVDVETEPLRSLVSRAKPRWLGERWVHQLTEKLPRGTVRSGTNAVADIVSDTRLNQYDILIAHFGQHGRRLARSKSLRTLHRPFLTFFHGYDIAIPFHDQTMSRYGRLISSGEMLLPVSRFFRNILLEAGAKPDQVKVHHMGVHSADIPFEPRPLLSDGLKFISVSRLVEKKGTEYAIKALALLFERRPDIDWTYDIIGEGSLKPSLEQLANELGIADRVHFLGARPHEQVIRCLRQADVFLHPSITAESGDMEGIPVVLMEAMAAGLLVVSTNHAGIPELVESGKTGLLAPERDADSLSNQLERIADHPDACKFMVHEARRVIERNFDQPRLDDVLARYDDRDCRS